MNRSVVASFISKNNRDRSRSPVLRGRPHSFPRSVRDEELRQQQQTQQHLYELQQYVNATHVEDERLKVGCSHRETEIINGIIECVDCGEHLDAVMDQEQEWRFYGDSDNKNMNDPSRCQTRKAPERGVRKELESLLLPQQIINISDRYYNEITQGDIKRGNLRKGILYACVYMAYVDIGKPQLPEQLYSLFNITKKDGTRGMDYFSDRSDKRSDNITPEHIIPKVCEKFDMTDEAIEEIIELYRLIKNKSHKLDHSYPQSVSCGCVYYMMRHKNAEITPEEFCERAGFYSSLTVKKKADEIDAILNSE